ncbi:MAG: DoxX family protein [Sheuella sp.]|nr:DoxX family protein [Sheuella sp.]
MFRADDAGKLILRLTLGMLLLMHGLHKLMNGIDGINAIVIANGWPQWIAYGVLVGEVLAPALIILGVITRVAALVVAVNMLVAIYLAHGHQLLQLTKTGGWILELQAMFLFVAIVIAFLGAGHYSLGGTRGRLN